MNGLVEPHFPERRSNKLHLGADATSGRLGFIFLLDHFPFLFFSFSLKYQVELGLAKTIAKTGALPRIES